MKHQEHAKCYPMDASKRSSWKDLPLRYSQHQTRHRWFQTYGSQGVFKQILTELGKELNQRGAIYFRETFIHGSFTLVIKG